MPTRPGSTLPALSDAADAQSSSNYFWRSANPNKMLLSDGDRELATLVDLNGSQLIIIDNGSFLLNLPLVNHERRKLAARLIEECGPPGRGVVFLESGEGGPVIGGESENATPTGLEAFLVWPISVLMLHLAVLGIIFSVAVFPIFGRPHEPEKPITSDFGKHIRALGELMQRSGDEDYARQQLRHYHDHVRRESGTSHRS